MKFTFRGFLLVLSIALGFLTFSNIKISSYSTAKLNFYFVILTRVTNFGCLTKT